MKLWGSGGEYPKNDTMLEEIYKNMGVGQNLLLSILMG